MPKLTRWTDDGQVEEIVTRILFGDVAFDVSDFDGSIQEVSHKVFVEQMYDFMLDTLQMGPANVVTKLTSPDMRFAGFAVWVGKVLTDGVYIFHCGDDYLKAQELAAEIEAAHIVARQEVEAHNDAAIAAWQEQEANDRYSIR